MRFLEWKLIAIYLTINIRKKKGKKVSAYYTMEHHASVDSIA